MAADAAAGRFLLLYGSQTGQAQAIAEEIYERAPKHGLQPELCCMSTVGKKVEEERCVVIVTSTTGDGDPPDTALKFVRRLNRKVLPSDHLAHLKYSVLGLGDSNYSNFCNNGKNVDRRLSELGASRFLPSVFADEVEGLEVSADPWIDALFPALQKLVGVSADTSSPHNNADVHNGDTTQCNGTPSPHSAPHNTSTLDSRSATDNVAATHNSENDPKSSGNDREKTTVPVVVNGTALVTEGEEKAETLGKGKDTPKIETLSDQKGHVDNDHVPEVPSHNADTEQVVDNSISHTEDKAHVSTEHIWDCSVSRTGEKDQMCVNDSSGPTLLKNMAECPEEQQIQVGDVLELNTPVTGVPSLGVSTPALSEKTLTLPAATPAFLTATYLSPDENLASKMAEMPWQNGCKPPSAASDIITATVSSAHRLTAEDAPKKTLLLKLCFRGSSITYRPGDSISVICTNDDKEVTQLIKRLGLTSQADLPLKLGIMSDTKKRRAAVPPHIPEEGATLRYVLKNCIDIRLPPKKALLRALVEFTCDTWEKRRLQELCSKEGGEDYTTFVHGQHVSLLDVLYTFTSCLPPVERLLEHLPRLQPRPYSVCSCEQWQPGHLDIAFNVVTIPPSPSRLYSRQGLCTGWLDEVTMAIQQPAGIGAADTSDVKELNHRMESMTLSDIKVQIFARTNQHFRTPSDLSLPLIMIGPGTGVAPYIGFLQERQLQMQKAGNGGSIGDTWLLFGCQYKDKNFLFQSAIQEFQDNKVLTKFLPAFSRDANNDEHAPRYVQDNIRSHASQLCRLIHDKGAVVFVCGDAKHMAVDVAAAFENIVAQQLELSEAKAKDYVMSMRIHHRYLEDVWT